MRYLRLKKNGDFRRLFKTGRRVYTPRLTIIYCPSREHTMGIALSKKHGKAVRRNRIKRVVRAAYGDSLNLLSTACSMVIMPKAGEEADYGRIKQDIESCFKRINSACRK